jgi:hypothetical protein
MVARTQTFVNTTLPGAFNTFKGKHLFLKVCCHQNGGYIQDGIENVYIFHPIFPKMIFFVNFSFVFIHFG